jgi:hypothetical protein
MHSPPTYCDRYFIDSATIHTLTLGHQVICDCDQLLCDSKILFPGRLFFSAYPCRLHSHFCLQTVTYT